MVMESRKLDARTADETLRLERQVLASDARVLSTTLRFLRRQLEYLALTSTGDERTLGIAGQLDTIARNVERRWAPS